MVTTIAAIPRCVFRRVARSLFRDEGQDLVEYGLLLMLIAVVVVGAVTLFGGDVNTLFEHALAELPS